MPIVYKDQDLLNRLKEMAVIDSKQLDEAYKVATENHDSFAKVLLNMNLISDIDLGKLLADMAGVLYINLANTPISMEVLKLIPEAFAKKQKVIAFKEDRQYIYVATNNPSNVQINDFVARKARKPVKIFYATDQDIDNTLILYIKNIREAFDRIISENVKQAQGRIKADPPIIKVVDTLVSYAEKNRASDIHIEPYENYTLVRFRVDGMLHDILRLPKELHPQIITRVKVLSKLRTDEHQAAQDGKFQFKTEDENLDVRVSIAPLTSGEKIVMRLLSERSRRFDLFSLGLSNYNLKRVQAAQAKPYGMILATGPTGCGKTMTMYTVLKLINKREINVMTIEDPVEYQIEGANQIQVNSRTNLNFAKGLRSIVRQDPDVILVGEIRDEETAGIAINSAMTGHLVLSTLHTNDAATAIPRFMDMGIEPFLLASSVNVIIAQRLVRKICQNCRMSYEADRKILAHQLTPALLKKFFPLKGKILMFKGKGCAICHNTGYKERTGIFEVLEIDDQIKKAIVDRENSSVINKIALKNGMTPMIEDGLDKIRNGITTIEEVIRVTKQ
jgi:type II secretory ATPase GspE/PulE/Tfp pilus assembly ATPase PilB-like protein